MTSTVIPLRQSTIEASLKQATFDSVAAPVLCIGSAARVLLMNSAAAAVLNAPADRWVGRHLSEVAFIDRPQRAARRWLRLWTRLLERGRVSVPAKIPLAGGRCLSVRIDAQVLRQGQDVVAVLVLHDMTAEREHARHARARESQNVALAGLRGGLSALIDAEQKIVWVSPTIHAWVGLGADDLRGLPFDYLLDEASAAHFGRVFAAARADCTQEIFRAVWRMRGRGGAPGYWLSCRLQNRLADANLRAVLLDAIGVDEAPDVSYMRKLEYRERLLDLALQSGDDFSAVVARVLRVTMETLAGNRVGYWRYLPEGHALQCEMVFDRATGRLVCGEAGDPIETIKHTSLTAFWDNPKTVAIVGAEPGEKLQELPAGARTVLVAPVLVDTKLQGALVIQDAQSRVWTDEDTEFATWAAKVMAVASQRARRQEEKVRIEQLAWYDALTGLPNRNLLRESLRSKITLATKHKRRLAVMLVDLDRFKDANDALGHLVGDALIKSTARVLLEVVGDDGMVARIGGDEFVVLIDEFEHRQEASLLAARIVQALDRTDQIPNAEVQVSASVGIAVFPEHGRDVSALLKNADAAMYQAKRNGRNQFSFFNPVRHERAAREVRLGVELYKALQSGAPQFYVEYQPQVDINTGRVVGLEALIRWQHPTYGKVAPDNFIAVAEASGLSERISRWVLNEVCAQITRWRVAAPTFNIPIAINVAGRELGSSALPLLVRAALLEHRIEPHMIVLEITERTSIQDGEVNNDVIIELATMGVGMALDDFGTGFSTLGYLKRMPIQALKIDQSFIRDVPGDVDSSAIVQAVLTVARHFKLKVIAEGVERQEQVDYLRSIGCGYAQGHLYSRALSAQAVVDYVGAAMPPLAVDDSDK